MGRKSTKQTFSPLPLNSTTKHATTSRGSGVLEQGNDSSNGNPDLVDENWEDLVEDDPKSISSRTLGDDDTDTEDTSDGTKYQVNPIASGNKDLNGDAGGNHTPWRNLFKDNRVREKGFPLKLENFDEARLCIDGKELDNLDDWGFCLIGYFASKFPGRAALNQICKSWGVHHELTMHESGWLIFKFNDWEAREKVLSEGPYYVFGRQLMLKEMPDMFRFDNHEFYKMPIWINLHCLPLECWNPKILSKIASRIGKPICTDKLTSTKERISYARILVEVDVSKELVRKVDITLPNGVEFTQKVVFEYEPKFCSECKMFGHSDQGCRFKKHLEDIQIRSNKAGKQGGVPKKIENGGDVGNKRAEIDKVGAGLKLVQSVQTRGAGHTVLQSGQTRDAGKSGVAGQNRDAACNVACNAVDTACNAACNAGDTACCAGDADCNGRDAVCNGRDAACNAGDVGCSGRDAACNAGDAGCNAGKTGCSDENVGRILDEQEQPEQPFIQVRKKGKEKAKKVEVNCEEPKGRKTNVDLKKVHTRASSSANTKGQALLSKPCP